MSLQTLLLKIVVLLTMDVLVIKACKPPNKETSSDKIEKSTILNRNIHLMTVYFTEPALLIPNFVLCFTLVTDVLSVSLHSLETLPKPCSQDTDHELYRLSPLFWGIFLLVAGGSSMRLLCYRTLGRLFTFQVTIRSNHKIVDSGLYAIVRHPSYTGTLFIWGGTALLAFSSQSPAITCGWAASYSSIKLFMALWAFYAVFFTYSLFERVVAEERNLQNHFGQAWNDYTKRVPYLYLPWIY